ncbi:hypothetical protein NK718_13300 [Alsobacter sp. SYSU M60028]|uniref:VapC45 PIN like domain-containing protein n=2 Tax=Alsobacter ponti TaxID=2962936 RepID=A0ABT1LDB2_9HYPH|nr:hypothetical protein [Alsobacter ponti]
MKPPFKVESHYKERFSENMADDEWLALVGRRGWIVLSHDAKFHKLPAELEAVKQHRIGCFYLWGAQMPTWYKIAHLAAIFPKISKIANRERRPYIYRANQQNRIFLVRHWDGRQEAKVHLQSSADGQTGRG